MKRGKWKEKQFPTGGLNLEKTDTNSDLVNYERKHIVRN